MTSSSVCRWCGDKREKLLCPQRRWQQDYCAESGAGSHIKSSTFPQQYIDHTMLSKGKAIIESSHTFTMSDQQSDMLYKLLLSIPQPWSLTWMLGCFQESAYWLSYQVLDGRVDIRLVTELEGWCIQQSSLKLGSIYRLLAPYPNSLPGQSYGMV